MGGDHTSHISAHESAATVAPFRTWRGLQRIVARGPIQSPLQLAVLAKEAALWANTVNMASNFSGIGIYNDCFKNFVIV